MILTGPMPTELHTAPMPAVPLLDLDMPVVPAAGIGVAPSGDYRLRGELAAVEKVIWATLLTPAGSLDWDPGFGAALSHKRLAPSDLAAVRRRVKQLVEGVPYVARVEVQVLFEQDEVVIALEVETDFGSLSTRREVG